MKPFSLCVLCALSVPLVQAGEFSLDGYLLADAGYYDAFYVKQEDGDSQGANRLQRELRTLNLSPVWKHQQWRLKTQYKWQTDHGEWGDTELRMTFAAGHVRIGRSELTTSQEDNLSYDTLPFIDRSMVVRAFAAGRQRLAGVRWQPDDGIHRLDLAAYLDDGRYHGSQIRLALTPGSDQWLWAVAAEHRDLHDELFQLKTEAAVHLSDKVIRSPRFYASEQQLLQSDLAWFSPTGWWSAEFWLTRVSSRDGRDFTFQGGYCQWVLNSHDSYRLRNFVTDARRRTLAGSWDYVLRAEFLDLEDQNYGARASNLTAGLNYHVSSQLSLMADVTHSQAAGQLVSARAVDSQARGQAIATRLRYLF